MTVTALATAEPPERRPSAEYLERLVSNLSGPLTALTSTLATAGADMVRVFLDQAYEDGRAEGLGIRQSRVGQRFVDGGVPGVLVLCSMCGGDGLLHQPDEYPLSPPPNAGVTTLLPRITDDTDPPEFTDVLRHRPLHPPS